MKVHTRPTILADVSNLAPRLRKADVEELAALGDVPEVALAESYSASTLCWTALYDGAPQVIFGVAPYPGGGTDGSPWLLSSDRVSEFSTTFLRHSARYIVRMHALYPTLRNFVHSDNTTSIMWLKWLGFRFTEVIHSPHDSSQLFIEFSRSNGSDRTPPKEKDHLRSHHDRSCN